MDKLYWESAYPDLVTFEEVCTKSRYQRHGQVITSRKHFVIKLLIPALDTWFWLARAHLHILKDTNLYVVIQYIPRNMHTVTALLCFVVVTHLTDFPISIRLTSLALWQSNDCPSASKATLMNMDKYFMWIHYERLHNHNKAKHNTTVCINFWDILYITINRVTGERQSSIPVWLEPLI